MDSEFRRLPSVEKVIEAMRKLEFLMVLAYTPSVTSDFADLVLPIAHPWEQSGLRFSSYGNWLSAMPKLVDPPDGCREDFQIVYDIAERMVEKGLPVRLIMRLGYGW